MNTVISIKAFFSAAYQGSFLFFVSVFRPSVSDPFPYLSYRPYLPVSGNEKDTESGREGTLRGECRIGVSLSERFGG
jgi:hypothetical protein